MRIDPGVSYPVFIQRPRSSADSPFSTALTAATAPAAPAGADTAAQPDFTDMTRKELFEWMNGKIRSGDMALDDSTAFLGMTVRIPVDAGQDAPIALDDRERVDFMRIAQDGIAGALSRHDDATRKSLETAMRIMRSGQGKGVDLRGWHLSCSS